MTGRRGTLHERIMAKVAVSEDGCWLWSGSRQKNGYAVIQRGGSENKLLRAHRALYEITKGPIAEGLDLDHLCRVRHCVNPDHLEPVTRAENVARGARRTGYAAERTHCKHGHPWTPESTYWMPSGARKCRICKRSQSQKRTAA